jgi:nucleoside-diphosphate-sugar epimerase
MQQELIKQIRKDCKLSLANYLESFDSLRNQSILITGGTGFIAKWITEAVCLLNDEHNWEIKLYLLARNIDEYKEEVPHLAAKTYINLIEQDVRNVSILPEDVSWVINAAGTPDNRKHISNPVKTVDTLYKGTQALLDACLRLPYLKKFVHISSNYVYGHSANSVNFIKESQFDSLDCNSVNATYGEAKRIAETICAIYRNQQKLPIAIVRPFSLIGPYQGLEKPWAINNFIRDAILGGPIRILGNEHTVRSYIYGSDAAFWLLKVLTEAKSGTTYNLGGVQPVSLRELTEKITGNFSNKIDVIVKSSRQFAASPVISVPDTSAIKEDLKVKQVIDFDSALTKTINWYKKIHQQ